MTYDAEVNANLFRGFPGLPDGTSFNGGPPVYRTVQAAIDARHTSFTLAPDIYIGIDFRRKHVQAFSGTAFDRCTFDGSLEDA